MLQLIEYNFCRNKATALRNGQRHGNSDVQHQWQLRWPAVMETAMANGKSDGNSNGWWQHDRDGGGDGRQRPQWQWLMATAMVMGNCNGDGNGDSDVVGDGDGDGDGNRNGDGRGMVTMAKSGLPLHVAAMCNAFGGATPCLHPHGHKQKCMHHGGDTAKSVCSTSKGRVPDSSPWIVFCLFFTTTVQFTEQPSVCPPALFRRSRTLSANGPSTSSTPPRTPPAYWQSTPAPIALFVKVSLGRAYNDYNLNFWCWCEMTNLSANFFISQTFALTLTDNTFVILKTPCCDTSWDIQGQSLSRGFNAFSCTTLLPGPGACICLATI